LKPVLELITNNKIGFVVGTAYSLFSFATFFVGLGYGASCPELGPDVCDNLPLHMAIVTSLPAFYISLIHSFSWSILFTILGGIIGLINPGFISEPDANFRNLMIMVGIVITGFWALVGAFVQRSIKKSVEQRKVESY
jgi:hypothetical protein